MRRGFSPSKTKEELSYRKQRDEPRRMNPVVNYWKYFCHYNNAVYQGGMNAYKKHGKGLLLHDDGATVITEYQHDTMCGHNIIFRENSISSVLFKNSSEYQIAYKVGKCIIKIPFMDNTLKPHGVGLLIDYEVFKIYEIVFKRGVLVDKILHLDRKNNDNAFRDNTIAKLIGVKHEQAFELTFQKPETMHVRYNNNQLTIGYHDQQGGLKGLAFKMYAQNADISGQKGLYLKYIQRGYYKHSHLQTYGQKYFSNGNKYIGQFLSGQFDGDGILLCPQQMKWVYGLFENGKLSSVKDSNNKKYTQNNFQMWNKGLLQIHQKYRQRYIDFDIQLPQELYLYNILKETLRMPVTEVDPDYQQAMKEDQYRMSRIQQQFLEANPGDSQRSYLDLQLEKHYAVKSNKPKPSDSPRTKNKNRIEEAPKKIRKNQLQVRIPTPIDRMIQKQIVNNFNFSSNSIQNKKTQPRQAQRQYRMKDPFQIQLIKVPYDEKDPPKQSFRPKDKVRQQERPKKSPTSPPQIEKSTKYSPKETKNEPINNIYKSNKSYNSLYSHHYLAQLQRNRQKYRRLQRDDQQYINYLRGGIQRSPLHRNYYRTPPKYDSYPHRYNGKIINKKVFNYKEPTAESQVRYSPQQYANQRVPSRDKSSSLDKSNSLVGSRDSPFKNSQNNYYKYRR